MPAFRTVLDRPPPRTECAVPECTRVRNGTRVLCAAHVDADPHVRHRRLPRTRSLGRDVYDVPVPGAAGPRDGVAADDCTKPAVCRGWCMTHYSRWRRGVAVDAPLTRHGEGNTDSHGYRRIYVDARLVFEHRHVLEQLLGRPLRDGETVHHRNGVRGDNDPANLELWTVRRPAGQRVVDLLAWAAAYPERLSVALGAERDARSASDPAIPNQTRRERTAPFLPPATSPRSEVVRSVALALAAGGHGPAGADGGPWAG